MQHLAASRLVSAGQGQHFRLWTVPERVSGPPLFLMPGAALVAARFCWQAALQALDGARARFGAPPPLMQHLGASRLVSAGRFLLAGAHTHTRHTHVDTFAHGALRSRCPSGSLTRQTHSRRTHVRSRCPSALPLPAETSREAPKCCAWQHQGGGGAQTVQSLKCCPLPAETSREAPKCCALGASRRGPRSALGYRPEPEVLPLPAETSREAAKCCAWQHQNKGPETRSGTVPEPEVLPLPAETSREAPKCCAWQHKGGGGPRNALGHPEPEVLPLPAETSREAPKCVSSVKRARAP